MDKKIIKASKDLYIRNLKRSISYKDYILETYNIDNEGYIFQGITKVNNYYFISAYKKNHNSCIFIYDNDFILVKKTNLYNNAHSGGICFDGNNTIYLTDKHGTISIYDLNEILNNDLVFPKNKQIDVSDGLINIFNQKACAYISFYNNKLYLGNFNEKKDSILKIYDKSLKEVKKTITNFHDLVQGVTLNNRFLIVSSSFGSINKSNVTIYEYDKDYNLSIKDTIKLPPMLEQIYLEDEKLICLFEVNSYIKKNKYKDILILDLNSILR